MEVLKYVIPALALIIVQLIISFKQQRITDFKVDMAINAIKEDILRLEKKQDMHNSLMERVTILEQRDLTLEKLMDIFKDSK